MEDFSKSVFQDIYKNVEKPWQESSDTTEEQWNAMDGLLQGVWGGLPASSETRFGNMKSTVEKTGERPRRVRKQLGAVWKKK